MMFSCRKKFSEFCRKTNFPFFSRKTNFLNLKTVFNRKNQFSRPKLCFLEHIAYIFMIFHQKSSERFESMKKCPGTYFVTVVEDTNLKKLVATTTLVLEQKFIHSAGVRARIEDVVVDSEYRGRKLGHLLVFDMFQIMYI